MRKFLYRLRTIALLAAPLGIFPGMGVASDEQIDPKADEALMRMSEFLSSQQAFSCSTRSAVKIEDGSKTSESITAGLIAVKNPNLVSFRITGGKAGVSVISDGSALWTYLPAQGAYTYKTAPDSVQGIAAGLIGALISQTPFHSFFFAEDYRVFFTEDSSQLVYEGLEDLDGTPCHVLKLSRKDSDITIWIEDSDRPFPRRIKPDLSDMMEQLRERNPNMSVEMSVSFNDWETGDSVSAEAFQFDPPQDAEEAESLYAILMSPPPHPLRGKEAPNVELAMLSGGDFELSNHKGKDIVILDFWATWCGPCIMALPVLSQVADEYKDKNVVFVAVNQNEDPERIRMFLESRELDIPVGLDTDGEASLRYYVSGIPQTVIIGKSGIVESVHVGVAPNLEEVLTGELNALLSGKSLAKGKKSQ